MNFKAKVKQATRKQVYAKIALMSPSGGGKTYSALKLATGMAKEIEKNTGKKAKILMGNTEKSRGVYYANEFDYDVVDLSAPFSPELYIELIEFAEEENYDILILDSSSPEWDGAGGCLEIHALIGGKYQDWAKVTPRHEKFLNAITNSSLHIIATMRGKDQYELEKDDNGKLSVKKLGVGSRQREGFEYEFTCTFLLDQKTHVAEAQKDNTHLFEDKLGLVLSEAHGERIIQWANDGEKVIEEPHVFVPKSPEIIKAKEEELENIKNTIKEIAIAMNNDGNAEKYQKLVAMYLGENGRVSEATIDDLDKVRDILEELAN